MGKPYIVRSDGDYVSGMYILIFYWSDGRVTRSFLSDRVEEKPEIHIPDRIELQTRINRYNIDAMSATGGDVRERIFLEAMKRRYELIK